MSDFTCPSEIRCFYPIFHIFILIGMFRDDFYVILNKIIKVVRIIATKICDTREY